MTTNKLHPAYFSLLLIDIEELLEEAFCQFDDKEENIEMVGDFMIDYYDSDLDHPELPKNIWERFSPYITKEEVQSYIDQINTKKERFNT